MKREEKEMAKIKKVFKYATGEKIPENAIYLTTIKNGIMDKEKEYKYVWHYFLVEVKDERQ